MIGPVWCVIIWNSSSKLGSMSGKSLLKTKEDKDANKGKTSHLPFSLNLFSFPCIDINLVVYDSEIRAHDLLMQTVTSPMSSIARKIIKIDSLSCSNHRSIRPL